ALSSFGGLRGSLAPATGATQLYRIIDALLDTKILLSYAWKSIDIVPVRTLPPQALGIAITPLLDEHVAPRVFALTPRLEERAVGALLDLRARGFVLAFFEVSPLPFVGPGRRRARDVAY